MMVTCCNGALLRAMSWRSVDMCSVNKVHIVQGNGDGIGKMLCKHCMKLSDIALSQCLLAQDSTCCLSHKASL